MFPGRGEQSWILLVGRVYFVGYGESAKAYQIYIPGQRKIELSRDVTFEEDIAYRRSRHT